jgi:hypothetical protein
MLPDNEKIRKIHSKFNIGLRWSVLGSTVYEISKTANNLLLFKILMPRTYGLLGSILSLIYLSSRISDFSSSHIVYPFFGEITKSKKCFRLGLMMIFAHQIPLVFVSALGAVIIYKLNFCYIPDSCCMICLVFLIILETARLFFRYFLHAAFKHKRIILIELASFFGYLSMIWLPLMLFQSSPTLKTVIVAHLVDSTVIVVAFLFLTITFYKKLPEANVVLDSSLKKRILKTRIFSSLLRLSKEVFSNNFLTPLFSMLFGFKRGGMFFLAGGIATSLQSIVKAGIGYSGGALLANIKSGTLAEKKAAFSLLGTKILKILTPIVLLLVFNIKNFMTISIEPQMNITILTFSLFALILLTEFVFAIYEQFYLVEEFPHKATLVRAIELALFCGLFWMGSYKSPSHILAILLLTRLISFTAFATHAYATWRLPIPRIKLSYLAGCTAASIATSQLLSLLL